MNPHSGSWAQAVAFTINLHKPTLLAVSFRKPLTKGIC
jgi:hypothetical protein